MRRGTNEGPWVTKENHNHIMDGHTIPDLRNCCELCKRTPTTLKNLRWDATLNWHVINGEIWYQIKNTVSFPLMKEGLFNGNVNRLICKICYYDLKHKSVFNDVIFETD
jgi:hypothetical protein